ncbi:DUF6302 family protein [Streptomyces sp. NPDC087440]|uniref:DUF6302 family protein n=1 Tax=Streptomyces sp. NPDC087440 TaxID=3365790 RepID=UPI003817EAA1
MTHPTEAVDWAYYRDRIAAPQLLNRARPVLLRGVPLLAVPAGGPRQGGFLSVATVADALDAVRALLGQPGFPDVRVRWSHSPDTCHSVEWGDRPPPGDDDTACGLHYGYRADVIRTYTAAVPQDP